MDKKKKRLAAIQRQQALVEAAKSAKRDMTAEEQAEFDSLQREIDRLTVEIAEDEQRSLGNQGGQANQQTAPAQAATPPAGTAANGSTDDVQRQINAERTRIANITAMCRDFDVEDKALHHGRSHRGSGEGCNPGKSANQPRPAPHWHPHLGNRRG